MRRCKPRTNPGAARRRRQAPSPRKSSTKSWRRLRRAEKYFLQRRRGACVEEALGLAHLLPSSDAGINVLPVARNLQATYHCALPSDDASARTYLLRWRGWRIDKDLMTGWAGCFLCAAANRPIQCRDEGYNAMLLASRCAPRSERITCPTRRNFRSWARATGARRADGCRHSTARSLRLCDRLTLHSSRPSCLCVRWQFVARQLVRHKMHGRRRDAHHGDLGRENLNKFGRRHHQGQEEPPGLEPPT